MKNSKRNIDRLVSKIINETLEEKADEIVERIKSKMNEGDVCEQCGSKGSMNEGECSECGYKKEETFEELFGGQDKLDVAEPKGKLTSADFKKLRSKKSEENESWGMVARAAAPIVASSMMSDTNEEEFDYVEDGEGETEEGNAFTGALSKAKEEGDETFNVGGKKYKVRESIQLTEDELIDVIEKLVNEETEKQKDNISKGFKPKGLSEYEKSINKSKKDTDEYIKSVTKKMKDYLKDASKGEYETNPKIFPAGNGELKKMDKKAYIPSDAAQEYIDNFTAAGQENLVYDEIHPNEEWVSDNIEGSSRTGNNPKWANAVETPTNKKRNKIRKDNLLGQVKSQAYNKSPQPIVKDETGEANQGGHMNLNLNKKANKILNQLESVNEKEEKLIKEEFNKINRLINYNQKTQ